MVSYWLLGLVKALFATILIEELAALFWKERSFRLASSVCIANIITNPILNLILLFAPDAWLATDCRYYMLVAVLEGSVWLSEAWWFGLFGGVCPLRRAILFSLVLNAASYLSSYPLERMGYWG